MKTKINIILLLFVILALMPFPIHGLTLEDIKMIDAASLKIVIIPKGTHVIIVQFWNNYIFVKWESYSGWIPRDKIIQLRCDPCDY